MHEYKLLEVKEKELDYLLRIYNHYIENTTVLLHENIISINDFRKVLCHEDSKYKSFTIFEHYYICGFCYITQYKNRKGYDRTAEVSLYLKPEYSGKGIGHIALKHLESIARNNGIKVLIATITGENIFSIKLFQKNGYKKCGHLEGAAEKFNKVLDVVIYQKKITSN